MKKIHWVAILFVSIVVALSSCESVETYADKVKKEKKSIDRFLKENSIEILNDVAIGQEFGEKQYYKDESNVYFRIIEAGDITRMASDSAKDISVRFATVMDLVENDTIHSGNHSQWMDIYPLKFTYGDRTTYRVVRNSVSTDINNYNHHLLMSPALALPLQYIGHGGRVSMLVPFTVGSQYQSNSSYSPFHYTELTYIIK